MHTQPMANSDGRFSAPTEVDARCRKRECLGIRATEETWDSHCGGYTDWRYTCTACGHVWWVEGPDS